MRKRETLGNLGKCLGAARGSRTGLELSAPQGRCKLNLEERAGPGFGEILAWTMLVLMCSGKVLIRELT